MPLEDGENALTLEASVGRSGTVTVAAEPPITIGLRTFNKRGKKDQPFGDKYVERHLVPLSVAQDGAYYDASSPAHRVVADTWGRIVTLNPNVGRWSEVIGSLRELDQASTGNCGPNSAAFLRYGGAKKIDEAPTESGVKLTRGLLRMLWLDMRAEAQRFMIDIDKITTDIGECPPDDAATLQTDIEDVNNGTFGGSMQRILNQFAPIRSDGKRQKWVHAQIPEDQHELMRKFRLATSQGAGIENDGGQVVRFFTDAIRDALQKSPDGVLVGIMIDDQRWRAPLDGYYRFANDDLQASCERMTKTQSSHWVVVTEVVNADNRDFPGTPNFKIFDPNQYLVEANGPMLALSNALLIAANTSAGGADQEYGAIVHAVERSNDTAIKANTPLGTIEASRDGRGLQKKKIVSLPTLALRAKEDAQYFNNYVEADKAARDKADDTGNLTVVVEVPAGTFAVAATDCPMDKILKGKLEEHEAPDPEESQYFDKFRYGIASVRFVGKVGKRKYLVGDSYTSASDLYDDERAESPSHRTKTFPMYVMKHESKDSE